MSDWYVYMVRCADNTLYTGITTDVTRRIAEHNGAGNGKGAKYTKARRPVELVYQKHVSDKSEAAKEEYRIRILPRTQKLKLIQ